MRPGLAHRAATAAAEVVEAVDMAAGAVVVEAEEDAAAAIVVATAETVAGAEDVTANGNISIPRIFFR